MAAWEVDGVETNITMRLADQNGNPVPEGTQVYFSASEGLIQDSCSTDDSSACSVTWTSQGGRPMGSGDFTIGADGEVTCPVAGEECRSGRAIILAVANGNESFLDVNGNGQYNLDTDRFATGGNCEANAPLPYSPGADIDKACDDLGEAYFDTNFNGALDGGERIAIDLNNSSDFNGPNGTYNGIYCGEEEAAAGNCSRETVTIRSQAQVIMASSDVYKVNNSLPGLPQSVNIDVDTTETFRLIMADINGNGLPEGTTISINDSMADNVTLTLGRETIGGSAEPIGVTLKLESDESEPAEGEFEVEITSGNKTTIFGPIGIN